MVVLLAAPMFLVVTVRWLRSLDLVYRRVGSVSIITMSWQVKVDNYSVIYKIRLRIFRLGFTL